MQSNYRPIDDYISLVDERNKDLKIDLLLGLTINKLFIPSVANIVGANMRNYKIIRKNQFACSIMQVRRDGKMPVALLQEFNEAIISQAYPVFEVKDENKLLPEYLMMWFSRPEFDREACFYAVGGVRGSLEWEDFCNMKLPVPSLETQRAIVAEYNTVKNRIALNNQLIQKLEEAAQTIYKQWFLDFEFPFDFAQGKPDENGKPYKSSGGKMVYNVELDKEIPEGWRIGAFSDILTLFSGFSFNGEEYSLNGGITVVRGENVTEKGFRWNTHKKWNKELPGRAKNCFLQPYDIIVGMDGSKVGKNWGIVSRYQLPLLLAQRVSCLRSNKDFYQSFVYFSFYENRFENYVGQVHTGTSVPHISGDQILEFPIIIPIEDLVKKFHENVVKFIDEIHNIIMENEKLQELIDLILSKMATIEN
jgi:type I restriction enzyme S subunit